MGGYEGHYYARVDGCCSLCLSGHIVEGRVKTRNPDQRMSLLLRALWLKCRCQINGSDLKLEDGSDLKSKNGMHRFITHAERVVVDHLNQSLKINVPLLDAFF